MKEYIHTSYKKDLKNQGAPKRSANINSLPCVQAREYKAESVDCLFFILDKDRQNFWSKQNNHVFEFPDNINKCVTHIARENRIATLRIC